MSLVELSQLVPELHKLLTVKVKRDQKSGRPKGGDAMPPGETSDSLPEGGAVNVCQVSQEETIGELAQRIVRENLSEMEVRDMAKALIKTASNATSGLSRLSQLRKELRNLNASEKIISATFDPKTTRL
ncbi:hypothetical protein RhiirA5_462556 [Rhizophagus irregularis]|uniref:Uncharacterized protein n=1 Tax=Rhizophagus irregularis TaxID=588596 RepID=A0A2N0NX69_9GLOM|nr:hypothetical protein RhiirA5_462556 [Rhizophagus irregularis]